MSEELQNQKYEYKNALILVVDDEPTNIKLIEKTLTADGYTNIITTTDPRKVVKMVEEHPCDLILLDLNMPYIDGFGVMEQLKVRFENSLAPILVLTAQGAQEFRLKALQGGARDYVTKPFDRYELLARARNLLEIQLAHRYVLNQNDILEEKVKQRTHELHNTRLQVVRRLGRAAEYRDNETGMHIIRMSKMSELLGRSIGMNDYDSDLLLHASPMHDIGKIGIPDNILLKPGRFEPEEWEIMKTHSQIGADILSGDDSDLLAMAKVIALTHHEKWDGTGYPNGASQEDIPLVGRIVAVADVFDALTSVRPYKKAWPIEEAVSFMKEQSGLHFQPLLVEAFMDNLPQIITIREKYADTDE